MFKKVCEDIAAGIVAQYAIGEIDRIAAAASLATVGLEYETIKILLDGAREKPSNVAPIFKPGDLHPTREAVRRLIVAVRNAANAATDLYCDTVRGEAVEAGQACYDQLLDMRNMLIDLDRLLAREIGKGEAA